MNQSVIDIYYELMMEQPLIMSLVGAAAFKAALLTYGGEHSEALDEFLARVNFQIDEFEVELLRLNHDE